LSEQAQGSLSWFILVVLMSWLTLLFFGFGLFARFNATVVVAFIAGALSVATACLLILDMNQPYRGWMQMSSAPLREALQEMDE
jgi:preprotein translocase subunit SecF